MRPIPQLHPAGDERREDEQREQRIAGAEGHALIVARRVSAGVKNASTRRDGENSERHGAGTVARSHCYERTD
jgi:hypothetical protein